jgi:predicted PurR-regulated permease PerM
MPVQKIDISSSSIWRFVLIVAVIWFVYVIRWLVLLLFGAVILSAAVQPIANRLEKFKIPRAVSVLVVYLVAAALLGLVITLVIPPLIEQTQSLLSSSPQLLMRAEEWLRVLPEEWRQGIVQSSQESLSRLGNQVGGLGANVFYRTRSFVGGIFTSFFMLAIAFYLAIQRDALKRLARLVVAKQHLPYVESRLDRVYKMVGWWALGQVALGIIIGLVTGIGLWLMGVKYALMLGVVAGVLEFIPVLGPVIAGGLAVTLTLAQSFWLAMGVLVFAVVVQQLEGSVLVPAIMKRTTGLNPLVTIIAVLMGGSLAGILGILLAVPTATILTMLLQDIFSSTKPARRN